MNARLLAALLVLGALGCTGKEAADNAAARRTPAPAPTTNPAIMSNPDDITQVTFVPTMGIDLTTMTMLPNGVYWKDLKNGTGPAADSGDVVAMHYRGQLPTGVQFDANQPPSAPYRFPLFSGAVVPGFDWGIKGMKRGGQRLVIIPPSLGYGARAYGPLPANAVLVFTIDLADLVPKR